MTARIPDLLLRRRLWLALGVPVAAVVALSAVASVSLFPPSVKGKSLAFVLASTQLYVMPHGSLGDALPGDDPKRFIPQTIVLANQMGSPELSGMIAAAAGIDARRLAVDGPVASYLPLAQQEPSGAKRATQVVAESDPYRVTIDENLALPEIGVTAQAPTRTDAARLAIAVQVAMAAYLTRRETDAQTPADQRLEVHSLAPVVISGNSSGGLAGVAGLTFLVTLALWVGLVFAVAGVARDLRSLRGRGELSPEVDDRAGR